MEPLTKVITIDDQVRDQLASILQLTNGLAQRAIKASRKEANYVDAMDDNFKLIRQLQQFQQVLMWAANTNKNNPRKG